MLRQRTGAPVKEMTDRQFDRWEWLGRWKHRLGFHSMVPVEEWNRETGSVRYIGLRCWFCEQGE